MDKDRLGVVPTQCRLSSHPSLSSSLPSPPSLPSLPPSCPHSSSTLPPRSSPFLLLSPLSPLLPPFLPFLRLMSLLFWWRRPPFLTSSFCGTRCKGSASRCWSVCCGRAVAGVVAAMADDVFGGRGEIERPREVLETNIGHHELVNHLAMLQFLAWCWM